MYSGVEFSSEVLFSEPLDFQFKFFFHTGQVSPIPSFKPFLSFFDFFLNHHFPSLFLFLQLTVYICEFTQELGGLD